MGSISTFPTHMSKLNQQHKRCRLIEIFIQTINLMFKYNKFEFFQSSMYSRGLKKFGQHLCLRGTHLKIKPVAQMLPVDKIYIKQKN